MKLSGKISIFVNSRGATIEVSDSVSGIQFLNIELSSEQFMSCLGRISKVECEFDLVGLDKVGKTMEIGEHKFKISSKDRSMDARESKLQQLAQSQLTDGWIADSYFGSKDSFFQKDGEQWARVTIRRWV